MSAVAENIQTEMPAPILFTDSAAAKVADLIAEEGNPDLKLRVFVQGGGCSGFQYGFTFDEITNEDDTTMTKNGVSLLIDAMSYQYLVGAEIDYKEDLQGAQFVIKNPNATSTCGCGSSFSQPDSRLAVRFRRGRLHPDMRAPRAPVTLCRLAVSRGHGLAGQPGKGGGFHLQRRQAMRCLRTRPRMLADGLAAGAIRWPLNAPPPHTIRPLCSVP